MFFSFFLFNDPATTEIYTLSLHDALPIYGRAGADDGPAWTYRALCGREDPLRNPALSRRGRTDRKSTRLNSSHGYISYAVFCLKKKKKKKKESKNKKKKK